MKEATMRKLRPTDRRRWTTVAMTIGIALSCCLGPNTTEASEEYKVGVYYFGMWSHKSGQWTIEKAKTIYGHTDDDPWGGTRQYCSGYEECWDNPLPWSDDFSHFRPAIGFYDYDNPSIVSEPMERHIRQAKTHGISFFNFYWYWSHADREPRNEEGLDRFLVARNSSDLSFMISIVSTAKTTGLVIEEKSGDWERAANTIIGYLKKPNYVVTSPANPQDARPIIYFLSTGGIVDEIELDSEGKVLSGTNQDLHGFIDLIKSKADIAELPEPFILVGFSKDIANADGYSCHTMGGLSRPPGSEKVGTLSLYNSKVKGELTYHDNNKTKPIMPCYMSDFNEKPRTCFNYSSLTACEQDAANAKLKVRYLSDTENGYFGKLDYGLRQVKSFMVGSNQGVLDGYVTLYAWNEWKEAGYNLEPSRKHLDASLNTVAEVFDLDTQAAGDTTCRAFGDCRNSYFTPKGTFDSATCSYLSGWARDGWGKNVDSTQPIYVHVYQGGPYGRGGRHIATVKANKLRTDLPFIDKNHGFRIPTPASLKTGTQEKVYIYAININGNGGSPAGLHNPLLNGGPKTLVCSP